MQLKRQQQQQQQQQPSNQRHVQLTTHHLHNQVNVIQVSTQPGKCDTGVPHTSTNLYTI